MLTASLAWGKEFPCLSWLISRIFSTHCSSASLASPYFSSCSGHLGLLEVHWRLSSPYVKLAWCTVELSVHHDILSYLHAPRFLSGISSSSSSIPVIISSPILLLVLCFPKVLSSALSDSVPFSWAISHTHLTSALNLDLQPNLFPKAPGWTLASPWMLYKHW